MNHKLPLAIMLSSALVLTGCKKMSTDDKLSLALAGGATFLSAFETTPEEYVNAGVVSSVYDAERMKKYGVSLTDAQQLSSLVFQSSLDFNDESTAKTYVNGLTALQSKMNDEEILQMRGDLYRSGVNFSSQQTFTHIAAAHDPKAKAQELINASLSEQEAKRQAKLQREKLEADKIAKAEEDKKRREAERNKPENILRTTYSNYLIASQCFKVRQGYVYQYVNTTQNESYAHFWCMAA